MIVDDHLESRLLSTEDVMDLQIREAVLGRNHRHGENAIPWKHILTIKRLKDIASDEEGLVFESKPRQT